MHNFDLISSSRAREDLRLANQKINTILADYGDVVPRRDYEMLETSYKVQWIVNNIIGCRMLL